MNKLNSTEEDFFKELHEIHMQGFVRGFVTGIAIMVVIAVVIVVAMRLY